LCFGKVPGSSPLAAAALVGLGRIALGQGQYDRATERFDRALALDSTSIQAAVLRAIAMARAGKVEQAREEFEKVLRLDPLNHAALRELALLSDGVEAPYRARLDRMLADDPHYRLDLACFYLDARLSQDAAAILREAAEVWDHAMVAYLAGEVELFRANEGAADKWFERAAAGTLHLVFPSRLEEVNALTHALMRNPKDAHACYALGNFFYAHERFDEAIRLWEQAAQTLVSFDVLHRNLGLAYRDRRNDPERAIEEFEKALALNPNNQDLYPELNRLYAARGLSQKRAELLESILAIREPRDDVHKLSIFMLVEMGDYESAIRKLATEQFVASEMDQSFRDAYVRAYLARAEVSMRTGCTAEAIADYIQALEYPQNVGVGRPVSPRQAKILYLLGCANEQVGRFQDALAAWKQAAGEHHSHGSELYPYLQMSLDKLNRYSEIRFF
ncbi:MAG: tetratricopeptide repeat protein, partial [Rudaea sp.]